MVKGKKIAARRRALKNMDIEMEDSLLLNTSSSSKWSFSTKLSQNSKSSAEISGSCSRLQHSDDEDSSAEDRLCGQDNSFEDRDSDQDNRYEARDSESDTGNESKEEKPATKKRKAAWIDDDDMKTKVKDVENTKRSKNRGKAPPSGVQYKNYPKMIKRRYAAVMGMPPAWADLDAADQAQQNGEDDDEDAIKVGPTFLHGGEGGALPPNDLHFRWIPDLNSDDARSHKKKFHSVSNNLRTIFSTQYPLALVTRRQVHKRGHGYASIYQVGAGKCFHLEHLLFQDFPITSSGFLPSEKKFVLGAGNAKHFYVYDMEACKQMRISWINPGRPRSMMSMSVISDTEVVFQEKDELTIMDTRTWRPAATLRPPSTIACMCSNAAGDSLYTLGKKDAKVYIWDLRSQRARGHFLDEGCIRGCSMALSPNSRYLACGSSTGIVNVYNAREAELSTQPKPAKILEQLVTSIDSLHFNSTSEALVFSSNELADAVRIAHFPSMRVFSNFPEPNKSIGKIVSCTFSPNSGYLAMGLATGEVKRLRLQYYGQH